MFHSPPVILFYHIPKTGGSTLRVVMGTQVESLGYIFRRLRPGEPRLKKMLDLYSQAARDKLGQLDDTDLGQLKIVAGHHHVIGLDKRFKGPSEYVTMVRHPVDLTVSNYLFTLRRSDHPRHKVLVENKRSLKDYALEMANYQVKRLGDFSLGDERLDDPFEQAMANLANFSVVGITERFDESLIVMKRRYGWRMPFYVSLNTAGQSHESVLDEETRQVIEEANQQDMTLYQEANRQLDALIEAEGQGFGRELKRFQALNGPINALASPLEPRLVRFYHKLKGYR